MKRFLALCLTMFVGIAIGAFALQKLHAQTKPKAYTVTEIEVLDASATAEFRKVVVPAIQAAGGRFLNTAGGKVVGIMGAAPPQRVALAEWDSAEQARAFYMSKAWADLSPQRDKAQKITRVYSVDVRELTSRDPDRLRQVRDAASARPRARRHRRSSVTLGLVKAIWLVVALLSIREGANGRRETFDD